MPVKKAYDLYKIEQTARDELLQFDIGRPGGYYAPKITEAELRTLYEEVLWLVEQVKESR